MGIVGDFGGEVEVSDWNEAIKKCAEICVELKETAGSLPITSKRQMAELCEKEILKELKSDLVVRQTNTSNP